MVSTERRQHPRLELGFPVRLHVFGQRKPVPGHLKDISLGGCFFLASPPLGPDVVTVAVSFRRQPPVIFGTGPIVRRDGDQGFGVRFDDASPDGIRFIDSMAAVELGLRPEFAEQFLDADVRVS